MTFAVQLLRDQVAKELQGSVTIIGKLFGRFFRYKMTHWLA